MAKTSLVNAYREYIACLNRQDWKQLGKFVHAAVFNNGQPIGLAHYRNMLIGNFRDIPDLHFNCQLLISDPPYIAARLEFDCTPTAAFLGLPVNRQRVSFNENVFYEFREDTIVQVWSVIDKAAIESQLTQRF